MPQLNCLIDREYLIQLVTDEPDSTFMCLIIISHLKMWSFNQQIIQDKDINRLKKSKDYAAEGKGLNNFLIIISHLKIIIMVV